ncbi:MAG: hypothetical protein L0216_15400 [Planctomycetales bacterium]|nr:hypothetical protein [Planctomycetales bacterium]
MASEGLFSGDPSNVARWAGLVGVLLALAAGAVLVTFLSRGHGWRASPAGRWTLLAGIVCLPSMTLFLGTAVGYERLPQSCMQACHTMDPWISDLLNPKSKNLAAMHWKHRWVNENPCYTCHTGYGLAGNIRAKIGGLGHVWHQVTGTVPAEIKLHGEYPMATCLHCHGETLGFRKAEAHNDPEAKGAILSGATSCFECHPPPHPRKDS